MTTGPARRTLGSGPVTSTTVEAVPPGPAEQTALARRLGYQEYPRQSFIDDYLRITRRARRAMERVFTEEVAPA